MSVIYSDSATAKIAALQKIQTSTTQLLGRVKAGDPNATYEVVRNQQYAYDKLLELVVALVSVGDRIQVTDGTGKPVAIIGQLEGDTFGIHATDAYFGGTLGDVDSAEVSIVDGSATFSGDVTAAAFNVWIPLIDSLTLTDNSPAAGRVAWAAFKLYFGGTEYSIASGNTSSSTHKHIYWVRGASTLTTATEMPQDIDNYLIASNISGVGEIVIGKPGAGKSVTEDALVPSLLKGMAGQPPATATITLNTGSTTIINDSSGGGVITAVYIKVTSSLTGTGTVQLKIQIDGETEQTYPLYTAANTASEDWNAISDGRSGDMSTSGDYRFMSSSIQFPYAMSASVKINVASSSYASGQLGVYVTRGIKTAA